MENVLIIGAVASLVMALRARDDVSENVYGVLFVAFGLMFSLAVAS